jgi:hypothetical protein
MEDVFPRISAWNLPEFAIPDTSEWSSMDPNQTYSGQRMAGQPDRPQNKINRREAP